MDCPIENNQTCPSPDIAAYVDGELSSGDELGLEIHIAQCGVCREDLNLQKSFLNALNLSIEEEDAIELPPDFTKTVVVNAESRVSGLRLPNERRNAALISIGLIVFSLVLLGGNADSAVAATAAVVEKIVVVLAATAHFVYDLALGSTIVFKSLAASLVFQSGAGIGLFVVIFVVSLYSFSRLWGRFDRT